MQRQEAVLLTVKKPVALNLAAQVMHPRAAAQTSHVQLIAPKLVALSKESIFITISSVHLLNRGMGAFLIPLHIRVVKYAVSRIVHDSAD